MTNTLILPGIRVSGIALRGRPTVGRPIAASVRPTPALVACWSRNASTGRLECRWARERQAAPEEGASRGTPLRLVA
ncbi:hypothetical protein [Mesorhizobium sp. STM 4661]|uniref:hypothetical protein n=1 Tax=Mesorhizobium sp. STM 4661 TaxID=1297570 RepID=UPI0012FABA38|nr:hypothetical protein [Mesorhizobium sp. STM 4661]